MKIFENLKVLELAGVLAGPMVGSFFAELGAEVIKVENAKTEGDITRRWKLPTEAKDSPISAYYASANYDKTVKMMDLSQPQEYQVLSKLIVDADIIICNFKKSSADKLALDFKSVKKINPAILYAQISGFPDHSKYADRPAFDVVLQAESGFMSMNGVQGGEGIKMPVALIDLLAAHQLKEGVLTALYRRSQGYEQAQYIEVSLYEAALSSLANQASNYLMQGSIAKRLGSLHPNIAPYGEQFVCADQKNLILAIGTDQQFEQLCVLIEKKSWSEDPRFKTNAARVIHRELLQQLLQEVFAQFRLEACLELFHKHGIPCAAIKNMKEVWEQEMAQDMILEDEIEGVKCRRARTVAFKIKT